MAKYKHILLATDLSPTTAPAHEKAVELAKQQAAKLTIIHIIEPIPAYGYPGFAELESPLIADAKKEISKLGKKLGIPAENQRIEFGSVKYQVLEAAKQIKADLIVIGSHGRHGLSLLLGSSASGIVHGSECDVLTVRCFE